MDITMLIPDWNGMNFRSDYCSVMGLVLNQSSDFVLVYLLLYI